MPDMPDMQDMQGLARCSILKCAGLRNGAVNTLTFLPRYLLVQAEMLMHLQQRL